MAASAPGSDAFRLHRLGKPEELRAAEELQHLGPAAALEGVAPLHLLRAVEDHGGLALGAFADIYLAGVSIGFLGFDGNALYHYVHRFAIRPEYQNHGLGQRLALAVREEVRRQGLESIRGTVDPLQSRAAYLLFHRLGATSNRYRVHYLGQIGSEGDADRESDRIEWRWAINDPRIEAELARPHEAATGPDPRFAKAPALLETETGESGLPLPSAVIEPTAPVVQLEIPFDVDLVRQHEPAGARRWRHAARDAFRSAFDLGYAVVGFDVVRRGHERRSVYLLEGPAARPGA